MLRHLLSAAILAALMLAAPQAAQAALTEDEVQKQLERAGVTVLKMWNVRTDAGPAYAVRVMYPGGNFNAAFRVDTIVVDANTGERVDPGKVTLGPSERLPHERRTPREPNHGMLRGGFVWR